MKYDCVIELLEEWAVNGAPIKFMGICGNLDRRFDFEFDVYLLLRDLWKDWEHYTGDAMYPVPGIYSLKPDKWIGEYGELRKDLCRHLAKKFKEMS